jgi:3'(2'), 5'-bisphosphate nucleotidase
MSLDLLPVARALAADAARRLMELRLTPLDKQRKADSSLVTNADHEADAIIRTGLRSHFPDHAILTEESTLHGDIAAEFVWVVDPLDGTRAYVRGTSGFSVMIGLLKNGKPYLGVVMDPWEGRLFEAVRGEGAFEMKGDKRIPLHVSARKKWEDMPLITSTGFPDPLAKQIRDILPCPWIQPTNSVGIKVGILVRKEADLYVNHHAVHYWDTVAPQILLEEAGGAFTMADGHPLRYDLRGDRRHAGPTLASNGQRHAEFVQKLSPLLQKN